MPWDENRRWPEAWVTRYSVTTGNSMTPVILAVAFDNVNNTVISIRNSY